MSYELTQTESGHWWCSCPAWKYSRGPVATRVCKHMIAAGVGGRTPSEPTVFDTAPEIELTSNRARPKRIPDGWVASEKYDGIFVRIQGGKMWTRSGQRLHPPAKWLPKFKYPVDGELYAGPGRLGRVLEIYQTRDPDLWSRLELKVFNVVAPGPFLERMRWAGRWGVAFFEPTEEALETIRASGGEGVVVRDPDSEYRVGRNRNSFKIKVWTERESRITHISAGRATLEDGVKVRADGKVGKSVKYRINGFNEHGRGGMTRVLQ